MKHLFFILFVSVFFIACGDQGISQEEFVNQVVEKACAKAKTHPKPKVMFGKYMNEMLVEEMQRQNKKNFNQLFDNPNFVDLLKVVTNEKCPGVM